MKYFKDDKVFVQLSDIKFLIDYGYKVPDPVLGRVSFLSEDNLDEFIGFDTKEEFYFFKSLPFIIDYEETIKLTDDALTEFFIYSQEELNHVQDLYKGVFSCKDIALLDMEYKRQRLRHDAIKRLYDERINSKENTNAKSLKLVKRVG